MATAATATSLLTGTTDILSTLSSDSPSGPQVSPTRARTAWDTLESLFYLRSDRESTISPHIQLFRDLALAVLSSRSSYAPRITPESRAGRTPLPVGSFERFLVDLNANVRLSLREDYGRRGSPGVDVPRRLNWWRAYQFPSVHVQQTSSSTSQEENTPVAGTNAPGSQGSPPGNDESTQNAATATNSGTLVPVVIVGLRSLARDPQHRPSSPSSIPPETTSGAGASGPRTTGQGDPVPTSSSTDEVDAITSSYVIIVLGGHYPPEHRYASATGSDDSNELDMLWYVDTSLLCSVECGMLTIEQCLICLEEYADDAEVRLLGCTHAFHRSCVDRWLTEGQNGCPLCRAQGVPR
ncbi:hypothetical protein M408DRAFT_16925 [Serendipita vermifera MAFF 305830]|uniref:RING-type domain-containing protein n=1 Tax=Serendipita vermifera MAFF 305830 TaxID=933852 RepID=A0A0C2XB25_SERVB|nr:hypothetical protein M408DRAFT_16925 [Serendipita vermifera MAFF 305830]